MSPRRALGDDVAKVDDYTVQIQQCEPNALFLPVLTIFGLLMYDKESMETNATADDPWSHDFANRREVPSFGAYCVDNWTKSDEISYTANKNYYRGAPADRKRPCAECRSPRTVSWSLRPARHSLPRPDATRIRLAAVARPASRSGGVTGNENLFLHMNFKTPPFDNPMVRQAIAHAITDRPDHRERLFRPGDALDRRRPLDLSRLQGTTQYAHDPESAKALLAEAGYPEGKGLDAFGDAFHLNYVAEKETTLGPIVNISNLPARIGIPGNA